MKKATIIFYNNISNTIQNVEYQVCVIPLEVSSQFTFLNFHVFRTKNYTLPRKRIHCGQMKIGLFCIVSHKPSLSVFTETATLLNGSSNDKMF